MIVDRVLIDALGSVVERSDRLKGAYVEVPFVIPGQEHFKCMYRRIFDKRIFRNEFCGLSVEYHETRVELCPCRWGN